MHVLLVDIEIRSSDWIDTFYDLALRTCMFVLADVIINAVGCIVTLFILICLLLVWQLWKNLSNHYLYG